MHTNYHDDHIQLATIRGDLTGKCDETKHTRTIGSVIKGETGNNLKLVSWQTCTSMASTCERGVMESRKYNSLTERWSRASAGGIVGFGKGVEQLCKFELQVLIVVHGPQHVRSCVL